MLDRPRAATVTATGPLKCVKLDRARYLIHTSGVPEIRIHTIRMFSAVFWIRIRLITLMRIRILNFIGCGSGSEFLFDADPDPNFHPDADPDPDFSFQ